MNSLRPGRLRGKNMDSLRKRVFERDNQRCTKCGGKVIFDSGFWNSMHLAHKKSRGAGGPDTEENTETLCQECHGKQHNCNGKPCPPKPKGGI